MRQIGVQILGNAFITYFESGRIGKQIAFALKWTIPLWILIIIIVCSLYYSGYANATIQTSVAANTLDEIDYNAPDESWIGKDFFCNLTLIAKEATNSTLYSQFVLDFTGGYGCDKANYVLI